MKKLSIATLAMAVLASACTKNITKLNNDTKSPTTVPSTTLFTYGEKNLVDALVGTSVSSTPFRVLAQSWTENTYVYEAQYSFSAYNAPSGFWGRMYANTTPNSVLNTLAAAKKLYPNDIADAASLRNWNIMTDILQVHAYALLVNTYGNIPYSQALQDSIPFPKYDDAKTVYLDLLHRLDTCIANINTSASISNSDADQLFYGDPVKWKKYAASLKLKLAMIMADVDPATAAAKVNEAVAAGVFTSNSDNAVYQYYSTSTSASNPVWQALVNSGRHDFCPANLLVETMKSWNDPRLPLYFNKVNGDYLGGFPGKGNSYSKFSTLSDQWLSPTFPGDILDYAEVEFLLAEAAARGMGVSGTAAEHYSKAVTASIEYWGGSAADAVAYLAQPSVNYVTAAGDYKQKIGYQKWIALADRGWDAWTEIRRLKQPNLDVVSPPTGAKSTLPLRFYYPNIEQTSNSAHWQEAVQAVTGGDADVVTAKLWWMK
jgi:hypothetical protein